VKQGTLPDEISFSCPSGKTCFKHSPVSYKVARQHLFGEIHLLGDTTSTYSLQTAYCEKVVTNKDFPANDGLSPMNIPDPKILNAEHTWPQSKFASGFSKETQKSDLNILLPVSSPVNSTRGNHPFGEVVTPTSIPCPLAALGKSAEGSVVFEPADSIKGNVARALFYFSIRYKAKIDPEQEKYLRKWHHQDPVDQEEVERNEMVFEIQKDRNPFIDSPDLVDSVDDF
jgi:deoxyribonuclease I